VNFNAREAAVLVTVGRWAMQMRLMPFAETLASGLDKVRGALSVSAQRDLVEYMHGLQFVGIPAHAAAPKVREAIEQSWFERRVLRIRYRDSEGKISTRTVRIQGVVMERSLSLLSCDDIERGEKRSFRLDRIERAEVEPLKLGGTQ
jgi:predicted DNA-binding transcriptional regulator YafY